MTAQAPGIEGRIDIRFTPRSAAGERVEIMSQRPLQATRLLEGRTGDEVLERIALIFSLCAEAQQLAARQALRQAQGAGDSVLLNQRLTADMECARELLLRLFLDDRELLGNDQGAGTLPHINGLTPRMRESATETEQLTAIETLERLLLEHVFLRPAADWLDIDRIDELENWLTNNDSPASRMLHFICENGWASQGSNETLALPPLPAAQLMPHLSEDAYIARPHWLGRQYETSSLTRQRYHPLIAELHREFGSGLLTRYTARLIELAGLPGRMRETLRHALPLAQGGALPSGQGLAQVEAARGRLVHAVTLKGDHVAEYRILAPTEWNFHPRGPVARMLSSIKAHNDADWRMLAELCIRVIDPCVGYRLEVA